MEHTDFRLFTKDVSEGKYAFKPLQQDVVEMQFRRGSIEMHWKTSLNLTEFYQSDLFLKRKVAANILNKTYKVDAKDNECGIKPAMRDSMLF